MLDEIVWQNASKFAIFWNKCKVFFTFSKFELDKGINKKELKLLEKKTYLGFHIPKVWQNFEAFLLRHNYPLIINTYISNDAKLTVKFF